MWTELIEICSTSSLLFAFLSSSIGYSNPSLFNMDEIHGGSPWGAGTFAGTDGSRQPSSLELGVAEHQGKHFATITGYIKTGKAAAAPAK
jgi:NAD(P)H dehydrogenase (quinone)